MMDPQYERVIENPEGTYAKSPPNVGMKGFIRYYRLKLGIREAA